MSLTDLSDGLFGTSVNLEVVERGLRRGLKTTKRSIGEKTIRRIGEDQIATLLNTVSNPNRPRNNYIGDSVKKGKLLLERRERNLKKWHNNEINFYEALANSSTKLKCIPTFYNGKRFDEENENMGFLCMEFAKNSHSITICECLSLAQTEEIISALVKVQMSMSHIEKEKKSAFAINVYEELYSDMLQSSILSFRLDELRSMDSSLSSLIEKIDCYDGRLVNVKAFRTGHLDLGMESVVVHGDLYTPNILWHYDENGKEKLNMIIDWQLKASYEQLFPTIALAFLTTAHKIFITSIKSCSEDERHQRTKAMVEKIRGILEDLIYFAKNKHEIL
ncbi:hypothetical protein DICVIV_13332 [Dictyocaulus viviparus]|uniref:CHK kinase-like domain-containing protein n=1 Tax=Dictyocaulus viviparus TaxID=29172 RepID=A0A0D8XE71_DICVI|nr:hypothetical protein DICVIV_13332 [Dictyocaulus viviparus]